MGPQDAAAYERRRNTLRPERVFSRSQAKFLTHLGTVVAPGLAELDSRGQWRFRTLINTMLLRRSESERRQIRLFLFVIRWLPAIVFFRPFERIPIGAQGWILRFLENAPLKLLRSGFWGLKTLLYLGYYGQPDVAEARHYVPDLKRGNELLQSGTRPLP